MSWKVSDSVHPFLAAAGEFVMSRVDRHTMLVSALASVRARETTPEAVPEAAPLFGWWQRGGGDVEAAFVWTPPHLLALSPTPAGTGAHEDLVRLIVHDRRAAAAMMADNGTAAGFAAAWTQETGLATNTRLTSRLYRLGELTPPRPAPDGAPRRATAADRPLLLDWCRAFTAEAGDLPADVETLVDDRLDHGGWMLWEAEGGPVALAGMTRPASGMARITPVYTPPAARRRGYGAAVTSAIAAAARNDGTPDVLLFTDLENSTSNRLYSRIGFRPVDDYTMLGLQAPEAGQP